MKQTVQEIRYPADVLLRTVAKNIDADLSPKAFLETQGWVLDRIKNEYILRTRPT